MGQTSARLVFAGFLLSLPAFSCDDAGDPGEGACHREADECVESGGEGGTGGEAGHGGKGGSGGKAGTGGKAGAEGKAGRAGANANGGSSTFTTPVAGTGAAGAGGTESEGGSSGEAERAGAGGEGGMSGGASGGEAGQAGAGGEGGASGEAGSVGGEAGSNTAGNGGSSGSGCDAIVLEGFEPNNGAWPDMNGQIAPFGPAWGDGERNHLAVHFDLTSGGEENGTITLGAGDQANFATCSHCVFAIVDGNRYFFATSGTLSLDSNSDQLHGYPHGELLGVTLQEVTIDTTTNQSTPLPDGACLLIANARVDIVPSGGWTHCPSDFRDDTYCDCGCGAFDSVGCADQTDDSCDSCWCTIDDWGSCEDTSVLPEDSGQCG